MMDEKRKSPMERISALLNAPRKPGVWWAHEVVERHRRGESVAPAVLKRAEEAIAESKSEEGT